MKLVSKLTVCCGWLSIAAAHAAGPSPLGCLIEPFRSSEVGSPVVGVIEAIYVERGDRVVRGQPLAALRSDVERQSVAVAQSRAAAIGDLEAAKANAELARQKLVRAQDLARQQFISGQALEQARAEAVVADNRLAQAKEQRDVYSHEHELAKAQLGLRTIRSPSDGVIADRYLSVGERVEEKPMFRVAVVDPLRVEVVLPVAMYSQVKRGMSMAIVPEFPGAKARLAQVVLVDSLIEGASNTFRARLELPNRDHALPAGLRCKAELADGSAAQARGGVEPRKGAEPPVGARPAPTAQASAPALRLSPTMTLSPTRP
ncbi:efflux RND transporter periplasmic adaptor subunit [Caenimonas koreensis]|uniref:efflux RND transporter periplasmic adaptor subunit n=1 Tax=Caenimonas koreensis TaxID=367474 RepID=UPI001298D1A2|nr:efflux RND transporter periplasmic adaptor subunit [Caenimonas koreensis]